MQSTPTSTAAGTTAPPALVIGTGISALGAVRALGRAGIPLYVLSTDPGYCRWSRWYRRPPGEDLLDDPSGLAGYLRHLPLEHGVLIPASDDAALAIGSLPPDLSERFSVSQPSMDLLSAFIDKDRFRALLERHGIPHPRTIPIESPEDVDGLPDEVIEHAFIKPRDSQEFFRRLRVKALRPRGRSDLVRELRRMEDEGLSVVLQEYVPGPPGSHWFLDGFVDREGGVQALLARRRLRMFPSDFGNSCATVSVPLEEARPAAADLERLFAAVGYRGMFDAEFKRDPRTGVFRLIEVNVRVWWQAEFAAMCGIDAVTMAYRDALGLPVPSTDGYRIGLKWLQPDQDISAWRELLASGDTHLGECIWSWLTSRWAGFALDDPLPGFAATARRTARFLGRRLRRENGHSSAPASRPATP